MDKYLEKNSYLTILEATIWASDFLKKNVTASNINYLIKYGKIKKYNFLNKKQSFIIKDELENYYFSISKNKELWKEKLGEDLNWDLSFDNLKEKDTTKHVHRLHPYKGKFIPQLVEYFLDSHIDNFKKEIYFKKGDVVLDPFCGSGTTLIQANESGINAIGVDISEFNALISNVKLSDIDLKLLKEQLESLTHKLIDFVENSTSYRFENKLSEILTSYNTKYFSMINFNYTYKNREIDKKKYIRYKLKEFLKIYYDLLHEYDIKLIIKEPHNFIEKWYLLPVLNEIYFLNTEIQKIKNNDALKIILSRTIRSCRATTHYDLGTLKNPIIEPYYCSKHFRICKLLFSILKWWNIYSKDTIKRLSEFRKIKTNTKQICLIGDSRNIDLNVVLKGKKLDGIFSSPPYVGLIDYHEQHAYSYDLFNFKRKDNDEIGSLFRGKGIEAQKSYVKGISNVLKNCKKFLKINANIFLVANDNYNLYYEIAKLSGMEIMEEFKRPVLNRLEGKEAYCEKIFRMKIKEQYE
ncbi:MAG: site-specific DNA-methyltransferase [Elusimicrobiota bacterium]|jgi:DNA modification methylase|nr:site-specific DNA-methyltransferase [Elusimicrobiota bacterium]